MQLKGVASSAINAVRSVLNSHSPSRVMMGIGGDFGEGFKIGIDDKKKSVANIAGGLGSSAIKAVKNAVNPSDVLGDVRSTLKNSNLKVPNIQGDIKSASASANANITHTHEYKTNPSQRVVTVKMDVNNDALTHIVNGQNADRDATFTF